MAKDNNLKASSIIHKLVIHEKKAVVKVCRQFYKMGYESGLRHAVSVAYNNFPLDELDELDWRDRDKELSALIRKKLYRK